MILRSVIVEPLDSGILCGSGQCVLSGACLASLVVPAISARFQAANKDCQANLPRAVAKTPEVCRQDYVFLGVLAMIFMFFRNPIAFFVRFGILLCEQARIG